MRSGLRRRIKACGAALALASLAATPLLAQATTTNSVTPAPTPPPDTVGPEQLRNFSLPGTVTRRTDTPPAATTNGAGSARPAESQPNGSAPLAVRTRPVIAQAPSRSVTVALPAPDPLSQEPTLAPPADETAALGAAPASVDSGSPPAIGAPAGGQRGSWLPWAFALFLVGAAAAYWLWRRQSASRLAYAGTPAGEYVGAVPAPAPVARRAQPAPTPVPAPPRTDSIISTSLRPWLEIELGATRAVVTNDAATVHFDITLYNSGSATARDVLIEGRMFNAGPDQDREIGSFMDQPSTGGETIPEIQPLTRFEFKSAVVLPMADVREYAVEGRRLFVPILGFNTLYRFGEKLGQTSASFIVGRGGSDGGKMAPIRLDLGPRVFRGLSQRQHSIGVRA